MALALFVAWPAEDGAGRALRRALGHALAALPGGLERRLVSVLIDAGRRAAGRRRACVAGGRRRGSSRSRRASRPASRSIRGRSRRHSSRTGAPPASTVSSCVPARWTRRPGPRWRRLRPVSPMCARSRLRAPAPNARGLEGRARSRAAAGRRPHLARGACRGAGRPLRSRRGALPARDRSSRRRRPAALRDRPLRAPGPRVAPAAARRHRRRLSRHRAGCGRAGHGQMGCATR